MKAEEYVICKDHGPIALYASKIGHYCPHCGKSLSVKRLWPNETPVPKAEGGKCAQCGKPCHTKACTHCGQIHR